MNTTGTAAALLNTRRAKSASDAKLIDVTEAKDSATLLAAHATLTRRGYSLTTEERLVSATIADVLTARHNLDDALDTVFDAHPEGMLTYHNALLLAMAAEAVQI